MGVSFPVLASMAKMAMLSVCWFSAISHLPAGAIAKWRGILPRVDWCWIGVSRPLFLSTANTAMLSWPRLEPYTGVIA